MSKDFLNLPTEIENSIRLQAELHHTGRAQSPYPDISASRDATRRQASTEVLVTAGSHKKDKLYDKSEALESSTGIVPDSSTYRRALVTSPEQKGPIGRQSVSPQQIEWPDTNETQERQGHTNSSPSPVLSRSRQLSGAVHVRVPELVETSDAMQLADPDYWTSERIRSWLSSNGFGLDWQDLLVDSDITGKKFLALTSYPRIRRVMGHHPLSSETGIRLCNAIRKMLEKSALDKSALVEQSGAVGTRGSPSQPLPKGHAQLDASTRSLFPREEHEISRLDHRKTRSADIVRHDQDTRDRFVTGSQGHDTERRIMDWARTSSSASWHATTHDQFAQDLTLDRPRVLIPKTSLEQSQRRLVQTSSDNINYRVIDISQTSRQHFRGDLLQKLNLIDARFYITEVGGALHGEFSVSERH